MARPDAPRLFGANHQNAVLQVLIIERCDPVREALTKYVESWHFEVDACTDLAQVSILAE